MARKTALVILGSGLYDIYKRRLSKTKELTTKYGDALYAELRDVKQEKTFVMFRHGKFHSLPPHLINYRANIEAAVQLDVDFILTTASVGAISPKLSIGDYVVLDQFIDFTEGRVSSFYNDPGAPFKHTDMSAPYSRTIRTAVIAAMKSNKIKRYHSAGTYVCTNGPRFETPAEIRMFRKMGGDVVGMTGVPEVVLAREAGIEYGTLALVTNMAAGLQIQVTQKEVNEVMSKTLIMTRAIMSKALEALLR
jgi:5'-methylthioadenosine phosphorylase